MAEVVSWAKRSLARLNKKGKCAKIWHYYLQRNIREIDLFLYILHDIFREIQELINFTKNLTIMAEVGPCCAKRTLAR